MREREKKGFDGLRIQADLKVCTTLLAFRKTYLLPASRFFNEILS